MRWLMTAVIGMGILIVAGVAVVIVTVIQRMSPTASPGVVPAQYSVAPSTIVAATLDEPEGTHVVSTSLAPDRVAVLLGGGGPDRVVIVDTRSGRVVGRVALAK